jgi:hypothetical protein
MREGIATKAQNNLNKFIGLYSYLNEETLAKAMAANQGRLLTGMLREGLNSLSIAYILLALGDSKKAEYIQLLWNYTTHPVAFIRESAYMALSCYPDEERPQYKYFINRFKNNLDLETSAGVKKTLINCIEWMEMMT